MVIKFNRLSRFFKHYFPGLNTFFWYIKACTASIIGRYLTKVDFDLKYLKETPKISTFKHVKDFLVLEKISVKLLVF